MTVVSKEIFYSALNNHSCDTLNHPGSSCIQNSLTTSRLMFIGCTKFTATLCLLQIIFKGKNITKQQFYEILEYGARLTLSGFSIGTFLCTSLCIHKKLFGTFNYYTSLTIPGFISGSSIFIIRRSKRHIFISSLACSALETFINLQWRNKNRKTGPLKLTVIFMLTNSLFMYFLKLWKLNRAGHSMPELWFFAPSHGSKAPSIGLNGNHEEKRRRPCNHIHSCIRSILKESSNYFCYGTAIEVLRIFAANVKIFVRKPWKMVPFLCTKSTLRVAAFAGLYVFLFKATNCILCRIYGDRPLNSLIAGLISGTSIYIYPKDTLIITAFVNLVQVIWRYYGINRKYLRNFYTSEFLFMLCWAFLCHYSVLASDHCSKFFINLLSLASGGKASEVWKTLQNNFNAQQIKCS